MIEATQPVPIVRPPRSMAWVLLLASAVAVLVTGGLATFVIFTERLPHPITVPTAFWPRRSICVGVFLSRDLIWRRRSHGSSRRKRRQVSKVAPPQHSMLW